jgi:Fur family ferric uptake transcriptional regulator
MLPTVADEVHAVVARRLRRVDQRYTSGRRALVEALEAAGRPVTIGELVATGPDLPQSTTYRNLAVLEQAGVVHRVVGADEFSRYELAEELTGHHHHLVCVSCGAVEDFEPPARFEQTLRAVIGKVTTGTGFTADAHRLDLLGTCSSCRA